jgi:hypothetical protein
MPQQEPAQTALIVKIIETMMSETLPTAVDIHHALTSMKSIAKSNDVKTNITRVIRVNAVAQGVEFKQDPCDEVEDVQDCCRLLLGGAGADGATNVFASLFSSGACKQIVLDARQACLQNEIDQGFAAKLYVYIYIYMKRLQIEARRFKQHSRSPMEHDLFGATPPWYV